MNMQPLTKKQLAGVVGGALRVLTPVGVFSPSDRVKQDIKANFLTVGPDGVMFHTHG